MENNIYLVDKTSLAEYLIGKYYDKFERVITPIKLQKGLYFLFAKWGGMIAKGQNASEIEQDTNSFHKYLFDENFCAWTYGPVDVDIYSWFKEQSFDINKAKGLLNHKIIFSQESNVEEKTLAEDFINETTERIFNTSDFGLVDLSHLDDCWKNARNRNDQRMSRDDIIADYAKR